MSVRYAALCRRNHTYRVKGAMIGRQARIIATMLVGAMLIAAGILFFFPAHAGVSCWTYKTQWETYTECR